MNKLFLLIVLLTPFYRTHGQSDVCICCTHHSLENSTDFSDIFPPALIHTQKIRTVTIYTETSPGSTGSTNLNYRERKFEMDDQGHVASKTEYGLNGKPHSLYEFKRNSSGNIIQRTRTNLDSLGRKYTRYLAPEIIDYTYDLKNRLIKIKERGEHGGVVPDEKAILTTFQYDDKGRLTRETKQYYFEGNNTPASIYTTITSYSDDKLVGIANRHENKKLINTKTIIYNNLWKPIKEQEHNRLMNQPPITTLYKYDSLGRLLYYDTKGGASECPDGGTFTERYEYGPKNFLTRIIYAYEDNKCIMTMEYQ